MVMKHDTVRRVGLVHATYKARHTRRNTNLATEDRDAKISSVLDIMQPMMFRIHVHNCM